MGALKKAPQTCIQAVQKVECDLSYLSPLFGWQVMVMRARDVHPISRRLTGSFISQELIHKMISRGGYLFRYDSSIGRDIQLVVVI
jgi:hypothetical protein